MKMASTKWKVRNSTSEVSDCKCKSWYAHYLNMYNIHCGLECPECSNKTFFTEDIKRWHHITCTKCNSDLGLKCSHLECDKISDSAAFVEKENVTNMTYVVPLCRKCSDIKSSEYFYIKKPPFYVYLCDFLN